MLAGFAERVCSKDQRGFLNNRFLLENVVDIDFEARRLYLKDTNGALVLIDLSAAFPSISQEYLFNVLERQGVPVCFRNAIKCFYKNNQHFTKMDGEVSESFRVQSGVRQGCPMSPVLFALALDPFLEHLRMHLPADCMVRAYADDMAVLLPRVTSVSLLPPLFDRLAKASSLHVNVSKTILTPLYKTDIQQARTDIQHSSWRSMSIEMGCSKYLGFLVGPMADASANFKVPFEKFKKRAAYWLGCTWLGAYFQTLGFNMFALSVFNFISQLYMPPPK